MKTKSVITLLCICINFFTTSLVAQQQNSTPKHLMREDSAAVNALVLYPDTIRIDIFEACEYPAAIVNIAALQKSSSNDFASMVSGYSKDEQEDIWNLSRYPDLISALVNGGEKSESEVENIVAQYPDDIHETALKYGRGHYELLQKINQSMSEADAKFKQVINDYPPVTQEALRELIGYPEIISLLNDHLSLTVRVGDHYRRDPQRVIQKADSLNQVEVRQNAEDAAAWKESVEQNPDEAADLKNAADDYAKENGYTSDEVNSAPDPQYVSNYTCNPYPYWFGYPTWYPYSYWYPYPYWFDCGFYHDAHGHMVIFGSPSAYFTNWYFYSPEHWHHYPHLANTYINHYYGPRRPVSSNTVIVHNWVRDNRNYLPKDFLTNNSKRPEVIKQVAQLNIDVKKQAPGKTITSAVRDQYFKNNTTKYPGLNASHEPALKVEEKKPDFPVQMQAPVKQPPVRISQPVQHQAQPQQPVVIPRQPKQNTQPAYNFNNINKAQEYHNNVWQQTQPISRPQPSPPPRQQIQQPPRQQMQQAPRPQMQQAPRQQAPMSQPAPSRKK